MNMPTRPSMRRQLLEAILSDLNLRPFIGGEFRNPSSKDGVSVIDPMTQQPLAEIPSASAADVDAAVLAARTAYDSGGWSQLHPRERAEYLHCLVDLINAHHNVLALVEAADTGKRYRGVQEWDIPNAAEVYRYYAGWADKLTGRVLPSSSGVEMFTRREPIGVCAAIVPWNFPFACVAWKIAPALAAGCTVVVKTSPRAPLSAQYLASLVEEAGFPQGVVNILCGDEETGRALVSDPRVDKITFTGAASTAQDILLTSLSHLPRVTLELGDKTPNVICEDADLERATTTAVSAIFNVSGQNCCGASRTLVHRGVLEQVVDRLATAAKARRLGDQFADDTEQGPQIDLAHVARIDQFVQEAVSAGGQCVVGGSPWGDKGQFYAPTIVTGTTNDMPINRQEVFGPVGTIIPFSDIDEAIHLANDRDFGLAAAIWTRNGKTSDYFARKVRAGTCWVNCYEYIDTVAPWGGRGLSGTGRELGYEGIEQFLETKTIIRVY
jgi:acyl-CoA reductase-like NAD-dependent aldehyde dehydrogenase